MFDLDSINGIRLLLPEAVAKQYKPGQEVYLYQHLTPYQVIRQVPDNNYFPRVWLELTSKKYD